jgi:hypothetical protein
VSSSNTDRAVESLGAGMLVCIAIGVAAVGIDATLRLPLGLPGHRGLTLMALLVTARCVTHRPWAATLAASSAAVAALTPALGLTPLAPWLYLLSGLVLDGLCLGARAWRGSIWFLTVAAGLGNAAKAIALWLMGDVVVGHGIWLAHGLAFSLLSHVAFGCLGGLVAAQLWSTTSKRSRTE